MDGKPAVDDGADGTGTDVGTDVADEDPGRRDGGCERFGPDSEGTARRGPGSIATGPPKGPGNGGEGFGTAAAAAAKVVNLPT